MWPAAPVQPVQFASLARTRSHGWTEVEPFGSYLVDSTAKGRSQRIAIDGAESNRVVPPPTFGELELARELADLARQVVHRRQIGVEPLACVEPLLLAGMAGEHRRLLVEYACDVDVHAGADQVAQRVAVAVRLGM